MMASTSSDTSSINDERSRFQGDEIQRQSDGNCICIILIIMIGIIILACVLTEPEPSHSLRANHTVIDSSPYHTFIPSPIPTNIPSSLPSPSPVFPVINLPTF